jgi:structural maintenance of chromosome 2
MFCSRYHEHGHCARAEPAGAYPFSANAQRNCSHALQDLIYKRGQAGVTKASVSIVFDNSDKSKCPPGMGLEKDAQIIVTRQIVLGGTTKYLLNGTRAHQATIQNMFHSVGLNINNPNFLIMQGRITKVLNMKATEFLSLIEEAAGTRMFEDRRDKALKTMAKKDKKVEEINELLREEIGPKLDKLRSEKRAFLDFQQTQSDLEKLTKLVVAHDYIKNKEKMQRSAADLEAKKQRVKFLEDNAIKLEKEVENLAEDAKRVKAQRDKELRKGGKFSALEEEVKEKSHEIVRLNTVLDLKSNGISEEKEKRKEIQKSVKDLEKVVREKTKGFDKLKESYDTAKAKHDSLSKETERQEELLQTLLTGVASKEGQESGYQSQLQGMISRSRWLSYSSLPHHRGQKPRQHRGDRARTGQAEDRPPKKENPRRRTSRQESEGAERNTSQGSRGTASSC